MNISDIITKCYILALIIRDDGERLLLGDGFYEFTEQLQHFQPNTFQNDVIELQGTDGQLLAGQVRRGATQSFDGYIADSTTSREATEEHRQRFLAFFRKKHHYKVVYVFPDGSAIKRERGYIVDAPSVPEMFQRFPEFHVGLNFEDVNYYEYEEGEDGEEIFAHVQNIAIAGYVEGGLIWDNYGAVSNDITWVDYALKTTTDGFAQITDGVLGAPMNLEQLFGNTTQETFTGKNLLDGSNPNAESTATATMANNTITVYSSEGSDFLHTAKYDADVSTNDVVRLSSIITSSDGQIFLQRWNGSSWSLIDGTQRVYTDGTTPATITYTVGSQYSKVRVLLYSNRSMIAGAVSATYKDTILTKNNADMTYEKFVGGIPAPNPQFPQAVNTVTGRQVIKIVPQQKNLADPQAFIDWINRTYALCVKYNWGNASTRPSYGSYQGRDHVAVFSADTLYSVRNNMSEPTFDEAKVIFDKLGTGEPFKTNTRYTISADAYCSPADYFNMVIRYTDGTNTSSPRWGTNQWKHNSFTSSANKTIATIEINYQAGKTGIDLDTFQIEEGTSESAYQPFVKQEQEINLGKNLLDIDNIAVTNAYIANDGTETPSSTNLLCDYQPVSPNTYYTLSVNTSIYNLAFAEYDANKTYISRTVVSPTSTNTIITTASTRYIRVSFNRNNTSAITRDYVKSIEPQLEKNDQATSYAPYFTPIELCKIGTYRDRIYDNDGEWFIHKETGTAIVSLGTTVYTLTGGNKGSTYAPANKIYTFNAGAFCEKSTQWRSGAYWDGCFYENAANFMFVGSSTDDSPALKAKYDGSKLIFILDTPTDTKITDQTLIQELSTIKALLGEVNDIFLIPSSGAQGEMEVRYSRGFINQGAGYVWDAAQGGGPNVVSVDGIDRTGFVWEVVGPATNPTLTNITTNQTMTFEGDVATGQTLTVNTSDQTAEIAGTNVFAQMESDWMQLAPGNNVITYTATGATEPSKIKWNGVVG